MRSHDSSRFRIVAALTTLACLCADGARPAFGQTDERPRVGLSASPFAVDRRGPVNNAHLMWAAADACDRFDLERATSEAGPFKTIHTGPGALFFDYDIADGTHFYRVKAYRNGQALTSNVARVDPMPMPNGLKEYSNQTADGDRLPGKPIEAGDTYYDFRTDRPAEASIPGKPGHDASKAVDGDYESFFQSDKKQWPFTFTVDLGETARVRNVQISWFLHKGSEAFYTYTINGSTDGRRWSTIVDRSRKDDPVLGKTYGFISHLLPAGPTARYVRVTVRGAHLHNNPNNWYPPTVYEVRVFGGK